MGKEERGPGPADRWGERKTDRKNTGTSTGVLQKQKKICSSVLERGLSADIEKRKKEDEKMYTV